jgi:hypothetical protein
MNCRKARQWISLERDDQLAPEHVAPLQDHLERCEDCRGYRADLDVGLRMLAATTPELPETFDWKLQLRLSQTLREAAQAEAPWPDAPHPWRQWFGRAGISAALGLAAVLAVAMVAPTQLAPVLGRDAATVAEAPQQPRLPLQTGLPAATATDLFDASRRPLEGRIRGGFSGLGGAGALQRDVSTGVLGKRHWSGANERDLLRISQLEQDLETLRRRLAAKDRTIDALQARLDSVTARPVDTNQEVIGTR